MRRLLSISAFAILLFAACNSAKTTQQSTSTASAEAATAWALGIALWTFHTFDFPGILARVDSSGLKYIEPNTFTKSGAVLNDSIISQLSPAGIEKLNEMIRAKGLHVRSIYAVGDSTITSWKHQFDIAKQLGATFVTAEPPLNMWDSIDSLAGVYGMKVAIHEHWKGFSHYWNPDTVLLAIKGHPNFGACADLGHWPKSGINPVDGVKKLRGHIIAIHLKDIAAYNNPSLLDVPVGTGVVNFPEVFTELKKQGFNGPIYIERDATDQPSNLPSVLQEITYYNNEVKKLK